MLPPVPASDVARHARAALDKGGTVRLGLISHPGSGDCASPVHIERKVLRVKRSNLELDHIGPERLTTIEYTARCRRCGPCLKQRARQWAYRARQELRLAERSWFGTLTLSPDSHFRAMIQAERRLRAGGERFEDVSLDAQFQLRNQQNQREITLWIKRVRKVSGSMIRLLIIAEAHKSGLPHYHVLVHQCGDGPPVLWKHLAGQWKLGYTKFNIVPEGDERAAFYLTKYLTKSALAKVRASVRYGNGLNHSVTVQTGA